MSYTRPPFDGADASWEGASAYTRPAFDAADASFEPPNTGIEAIGAATIGPVTAAAQVAHGVAVVGGAVIGPVTAAGVVEFTSPEVFMVGAATIGPVTATAVAAHGVAAVGAAVLGPVGAAAQAGHGLSAVGAAHIGPLSAAGVVAHGIAGAGVAVIAPIAAAGVALHPRYVLQGEVRDGGVLVNRTVRAYLRSTGALVGEQVPDAGRFDIHAGFSEAEHYILPVDLDEGATDWAPPTRNRILSKLAVD